MTARYPTTKGPDLGCSGPSRCTGCWYWLRRRLADRRGERWRQVHTLFGYTMAGLVVFRLIWGLVGSKYARFSNFVRGPSLYSPTSKSLRSREPPHHVGPQPGWRTGYRRLAGGDPDHRRNRLGQPQRSRRALGRRRMSWLLTPCCCWSACTLPACWSAACCIRKILSAAC